MPLSRNNSTWIPTGSSAPAPSLFCGQYCCLYWKLNTVVLVGPVFLPAFLVAWGLLLEGKLSLTPQQLQLGGTPLPSPLLSAFANDFLECLRLSPLRTIAS
jgi:hypothetical protein